MYRKVISGLAVVVALGVALLALVGCPLDQTTYVKVPDVVGLTEQEARDEILGVGLVVGSVTQAYSDSEPAGTVISQAPAPDAEAVWGSPVNMVRSKGPRPDGVDGVPDVVGMSESDAAAALEEAGLTVGEVTEEYDDDAAAGVVISQDPDVGEDFEPGDSVDLVVSLGPEDDTTDPKTIMLPGDVPLELVWIPGGSFKMGCVDDEQDAESNEEPRHTVNVQGFWIGQFEVTKEQWEAVMETVPWATLVPNDDADTPAVFLTWNDAKLFTSELTDFTGKTFRLPSEAEWEYACRAGATTRYYWGDDPDDKEIDDYAWSRRLAYDLDERYAHPVGELLPNEWDLYDMSGNVWEWCEDDKHTNYKGAPIDGSAWVDSPRSNYRVLRGGGWPHNADQCRSANRSHDHMSEANERIGFRVVMEAGS